MQHIFMLRYVFLTHLCFLFWVCHPISQSNQKSQNDDCSFSHSTLHIFTKFSLSDLRILFVLFFNNDCFHFYQHCHYPLKQLISYSSLQHVLVMLLTPIPKLSCIQSVPHYCYHYCYPPIVQVWPCHSSSDSIDDNRHDTMSRSSQICCIYMSTLIF